MLAKLSRSLYVANTLVIVGFNHVISRKEHATDELFKRLSALGGIYIKFLQLLALSENTSTGYASSLKDVLAVYDKAPFEQIDILSLLRAELGINANAVELESITPFAAGSFAQVYRGNLAGQPIIVKVLRPSVSQFLRSDLALLGFVVRLIAILQPKGMLDAPTIFKDFSRITLEEVDYKHEVSNAIELKKQLAGHPVIYIPTTYAEFSTARIILQEYIVGLPLTQLLASGIDDKAQYVSNTYGTDLSYVVEELAVELLGGSLGNGISHGDPHPGNIYLLPNNRVALIDFGIGATVQHHKSELLQLIAQYAALYRGEFNPEQFSQAIFRYFVPELNHSIQTLSAYFDKQDLITNTLQEIGQSATKTLYDQQHDPALAAMLGQYRMLNIFTQVINKNNRFGLNTTIENPAFIRSSQIFMHIVNRLGCDKQLLRRSFERVLAANNSLQPTQDFAYDNESIDYSLHRIASWFEQLQYSDPRLCDRIMKTWEGVV